MRALISGAGISGPALAWFLAKTGAQVTIVEKSHALLAHGQNVDVTGSAIKVVERMGLMGKLREFNTSEKGTAFINDKGQPFASLPIREGLSASLSNEFEILRADLAKILFNSTTEFPNVSYRFGTTINRIITNDEKAVNVELSSGEVQQFDILVVADGQWSRLRKEYFSQRTKVIDLGMFVGYWTLPRLPSDNDFWNIFIGLKGRLFSLRPDPHGTTRAMITSMPRNEAQKAVWKKMCRAGREAQQDFLRDEFADMGWQAKRLLDGMSEAPDFYFHEIQQIRMSKWSESRVICLGDAAYAPSPMAGGGTSLALIGAYVLAGELSQLKEGDHPSVAFEAYENLYRPFIEDAQSIPSIFPGAAHPRTAWQRWLLQSLLSVAAKVVASPWMAYLGGKERNDNFPLPQYSKLDQGENTTTA